MLAIARRKYPRLRFVQADLRGEWPPELDGRYHVLVSAYVFHHFPLNEKVRMLRALADEKEVHYVDVAEGVMDDEGYLPFEATGDGVHLTPEYCVVWMDYLRTHTAQ